MANQELTENNKENGNRYSIEFNNVVYEVPNKNVGSATSSYLRLIRGFNGKFESGKLTAIMGPSGSCKTTFLDLLVGRNQPGSKTTGKILFKGKERDPGMWGTQFAYLEQDDFIISGQTAYEFIHFAISCRKSDWSEKEIEYAIDDAMEALRISHLRDVELDVISGGERKRVMIVIEFIAEADILILDEPTSGLDSNLALQLIYMLKEYAHKKNKIVLMTIHQPGSGLFELIDDFFFVYKGVIMYSGPVKGIDSWLDENKLKISNHLSKPEFLFELFTRNSVFPEVRALDTIVLLMIDAKEKEAQDKYGNTRLRFGTVSFTVDYSICFRHIYNLMARGFKLSFQGSGVFGIFIRYVILCALVCLMLLMGKQSDSDVLTRKVDHYDETTKSETIKFIYYNIVSGPGINIILYLMGIFSNISGFSNRDCVPREIAKATYSLGSYYLAVLFSELIMDMLKIFFVVVCSLWSSKQLQV